MSMNGKIDFGLFDVTEVTSDSGRVVRVTDYNSERVPSELVAEYVTRDDEVIFHMCEEEQYRRFGVELDEEGVKAVINHWL